jgi:uncharacterized protein
VSAELRAIQAVPMSVTAFVGEAPRGPLHTPVQVSSFAEFEQHFGGLDSSKELGYEVFQFFANGGTAAWIVRSPDNDGLLDALNSLDSMDGFGLLAMPSVTSPEVFSAAVAFCQRHRAFYIVDPPREAGGHSDLAKFLNTLGIGASPNAAIFYPWVKVPDPAEGGRLRLCAPSGSVAGVIARTDTERGVWKTPAGTEAHLHGVAQLASEVSAEDAAALNARAINCLRLFPPHGPVVWGSRTLAGADAQASEFKYIPVRRLALLIEQCLYRGTQWAVSEPNDEALWTQITASVGAFLDALFRQGAFAGATSTQAYFVKCGATTMTPQDLERGLLNIVIGFAPLRAAEFIVSRVVQKVSV